MANPDPSVPPGYFRAQDGSLHPFSFLGSQPPPPPPPKKVSTGWLWLLLPLVVCCGGSVAAAVAGYDSEPSAAEREIGAFEICKEFVKDRLKAPSTAKFRNFSEDDGEVIVSGSGSGPYKVVSTVDSQNSFGAMIRIPFECVVTNTSGDSWRLDDITIVE